VLLNEDFALEYLADAVSESFGRVLLMKNARHTGANHAKSVTVRQTSSNEQNLSLEAGTAQCLYESLGGVRTQIVVKQEHVDLFAPNCIERGGWNPAGANEDELGVGCEQADQTLSEQCVIIQQKQSDYLR
jgi:hypothetical protein